MEEDHVKNNLNELSSSLRKKALQAKNKLKYSHGKSTMLKMISELLAPFKRGYKAKNRLKYSHGYA